MRRRVEWAPKGKATTAVGAVANAAGTGAASANHIESTSSKLKRPLLDAVTKVCALKNQP